MNAVTAVNPVLCHCAVKMPFSLLVCLVSPGWLLNSGGGNGWLYCEPASRLVVYSRPTCCLKANLMFRPSTGVSPATCAALIGIHRAKMQIEIIL